MITGKFSPTEVVFFVGHLKHFKHFKAKKACLAMHRFLGHVLETVASNL
jgi:hypothetical protein